MKTSTDRAPDVAALEARIAELVRPRAQRGRALLDAAEDSADFRQVYAVIRRMLDARYPGAVALVTEGLSHYRTHGDAGVDAFLAGATAQGDRR